MMSSSFATANSAALFNLPLGGVEIWFWLVYLLQETAVGLNSRGEVTANVSEKKTDRLGFN